MIKLKNILTEAYAWERQAGKALPTLAEVQAAYDARRCDHEEEVDDDGYPVMDGGRPSGSSADDPFDTDPEEEVDDDGYPVMDGGRPSGSSAVILMIDNDYMDEAAKPDFLDLDGDGDETEPMKSAAADSTAHGNFVNRSSSKIRCN
jgi:hypothetical protein